MIYLYMVLVVPVHSQHKDRSHYNKYLFKFLICNSYYMSSRFNPTTPIILCW